MEVWGFFSSLGLRSVKLHVKGYGFQHLAELDEEDWDSLRASLPTAAVGGI